MTSCGMARLPTRRTTSAEASASASMSISVYSMPWASRNFLAARQSPHQETAYICTFMRSFYCVHAGTISDVTAGEIKKLLNLEPHPAEGGFYRRTYASEGTV